MYEIIPFGKFAKQIYFRKVILCKYCVKFNYIEMSLEELYTTNDMKLHKKAIVELIAKEDFKTINILF